MIELYINGSLCDIKGTSIAISKAVTDGVDRVKGGWSKSFNISATPTNRDILKYVEVLQSENGIDKNTLAEAILRNGIEILKGKALVESVTINDTDYYEINIISGNKSWVAEMGEKTFADLDFSDGDFVFDKDMIPSTGNVIMPLINFGYLKNNNGILDFDNFRPAYKVGWILQKAFGLTSYSVEYPALFDKLVIPHTGKFSMTDEARDDLHAKLYQDETVSFITTLDVYETVTFNYELKDPGNHVTSSVYISDFTGYLRFHFTMEYATNSNGYGYFYWYLICSDGTMTEIHIDTYGSDHESEIQDFVVTKDIYVENGKSYRFAVKCNTIGVSYKNSYLEIERLEKYYYGETISLNVIMPKWSIKNFIKGLDQLFNLIFDIDEETNKVKIEFEDTYYESGSVRELNPLKSDIKMSWYDTAKETVFGYKKDTNDYAVNRLEVDGRYFFDKTFEFQNKYNDKKEEKRNDFFATTIMTNNVQHITDLPNVITPYVKKSETTGFKSDGYQPRLLYSDGLQNISGGYYIYSEKISNQLINAFNLCYSYYNPSNVLYPPNSYPINLSFNKIYDVEGLLSKYHKNKLKRLDIGRKIELTVKITLAEFNDWSFKDTFKINIPDWHEINGYYHLLEIKNFNPDKDTVKLLLVQAFKTSSDYTPPYNPVDDASIYLTDGPTDDGIHFSGGDVVVVSGGESIAMIGATGNESKYKGLYYMDSGDIKPLYYMDGDEIKRLKA